MPSSRAIALTGSLLLVALASGCAATGGRVVTAGAIPDEVAPSLVARLAPPPPTTTTASTTTTAPAPEVASAPAPTVPPETVPPETVPPETVPPETVPPTTVAPEPDPPSYGVAAPPGTWFDSTGEWEFLALTNAERARIGVGGLARDASLDEYARAHAVAMMGGGHIYHSEIGNLLGSWWTVGENVGVGPTVQPIQNALLASPPHYQNISLAEYTSMGVGVLADATGRIWTVHIFAAPVRRHG
ncbi:MAG: hypothetical protein GEV08_07850 [Acidimicrobiia bacterium]|nr:hypothetical protein [Acidimicrobiia bacterium]